MSKPAVSPSRIRSHIETRFGDVSDLRSVSDGEDSQAFGFTGDGDPYIVRINHSSAGFEKDLFLFQRFAGIDLPIPEIVSIDHLADGDACCVSRRAAGVTLEDLAPDALPPVLGPVSAVMDVMAHRDVSGTLGFGPFDKSGLGSFQSWRDFLLGASDPKHHDWKRARPFDMDRVGRLLGLIHALAVHCPEIRGLVHGDFGSNNVLTDGHAITGVIDWSEAMLGDPLYDVANILFWRPWLDCMEQQARFFETRQPERLRHRQRLMCYQLRIGVEVLYQAILDQNDHETDWAMARCESIADDRR